MPTLSPSRPGSRLGIWLLLAFCCQPLAALAQFDTARVIVKLRPDAALTRKHALAAGAGASATREALAGRSDALGARLGLPLRPGRAIDAQAQVITAIGMSSADLAERLAAQADVEYAVVDRRRRHQALPSDPLYAAGPPIVGNSGGPVAGQWYLRPPIATLVSSINAAGAWDLTTGGAGIVVAVLDSGVRPEHPDLQGRLLPGYNMIADIPTANDGEGRDADASDPGDWVTTSESKDVLGAFYQCDVGDSSWHGTMTSSLIGAAANNGIGMAGVAWGVRLLPVRVLGKCGGYDSDIIAGMRWAAGLSVPGVPGNPNPARVINMSLGGDGACTAAYSDAVSTLAGKANPVVVVVSAGNSSGLAVTSPANCPGVIAVAGLRHIGSKVGYSDLGPEIAIAAPAGNCVNEGANSPCLYPILAASNSGLTTPGTSIYTDAFNASYGTSFAAPLVAGTAALMLSVQPALTPSQIKAALQGSARTFPRSGADASVVDCHAPGSSTQKECYCTTSTCGAGMLDTAAAVASAMPARNVVEFYNTILDNYFITADANEAAAIDAGSAGPGWSRTGTSFKSGGNKAVCRFYGSQSPGPNSHFYTVDSAECDFLKQLQAATPATQKRWNFESLDFIATPPANGACAGATVPVYRAYNNGYARGVDSNHRISSSLAAIQAVLARGWSYEGVVMCAPQ